MQLLIGHGQVPTIMPEASNIIQIMKVSDSMAYLKNGEMLPISRSHLQEVKKQINRFWGAHI